MKRFFFVTGKGGVGKTTLALAKTLKLHRENKKVLYLSFDEQQYHPTLDELQIPYQKISITECSIEYIANKLKSRFIAKTVVKTPFYRSLSSIVPGFDNIILLGKIYELLKDPELTIVLDAPATGHALTAIESLRTFKKVFNQGLVFKDIQSMASLLLSDEMTEIITVSLPENLVDMETEEFRAKLRSRDLPSTKVINKVLSLNPEITSPENNEKAPEIIQKKIEQENNFLKTIKETSMIPFFLESEMKEVILKINQQVGKLI